MDNILWRLSGGEIAETMASKGGLSVSKVFLDGDFLSGETFDGRTFEAAREDKGVFMLKLSADDSEIVTAFARVVGFDPIIRYVDKFRGNIHYHWYDGDLHFYVSGLKEKSYAMEITVLG